MTRGSRGTRHNNTEEKSVLYLHVKIVVFIRNVGVFGEIRKTWHDMKT